MQRFRLSFSTDAVNQRGLRPRLRRIRNFFFRAHRASLPQCALLAGKESSIRLRFTAR